MLKLILLTIVSLFGVLAIYGTPEMAGGSTIADDPPVAVPEVPQQVSYTAPATTPAQPGRPVRSPAELLAAAMSVPSAQGPAFTGPRLQPSPEQTRQTAAASALSGEALFVAGNKVNLRAAPDASAPVLASLGVGTAVRPVGSAAGPWVEVEAGDQRGFVSARYLSSRNPG